MEIKEHIQFLEEQILKGDQFLKNALEKANNNLAALNIYNRFNNIIELGLIQWRMGKSPVAQFGQALQFILNGREALLDRGMRSPQINELPLRYSIYVASLLDMPHPALEYKDYSRHLIPTVFFGNVLLGTDSIENWPNYEDHLPHQKRTALARATNDLYAGLLAGTISPEEGVKMGEKYYIRRKTDPYFLDGESLHGGTHLNDRFVDFRLAAVLKKIGSTVPTVHAWRW